MTTLELFRKHRKGEVSRERFLYEVRRDSNLPWVTNTTSYNDAVKILKNKGIIREAQFEPQNITTDPAVDRVNPYALKREVEKLLSKEKVLTNDSYKEALNKAAKKLANPQAVKASMFANADSVAKADANLQTQEVKKANHVDKKNSMKKAKGQQMPKATSAPTKENRKTKKPKGVEVMKDKGVEGSEKIIKEISQYLKKKLKLSENSPYNEFHLGMTVPMENGEGVVKEINGGTLCLEMPDGSMLDMQMGEAKRRVEQSKEQSYQESGFDQKDGAEVDQLEEDFQQDYYINVSIRDAARAIEVYRDLNSIPQGSVQMDGTDSYVIDNLETAQELLSAFQEQDIEVIDTDVPSDEDDNFGYGEEDWNEMGAEDEDDKHPGGYPGMTEARDINDPARMSSAARIHAFKQRQAQPKQSLAQLMGQRDNDFEIEQELKALKKERFQLMRDMEQEAEPEGGPIADDYGDRLNQLDQQIADLEAQLNNQDLYEDDNFGYGEEDLEESTSSDFQNGDKVKIKGEMSRHRGSTGEIHDIHEDGTALVILDGPGNPTVTVKLSDLRKDGLEEAGIEITPRGGTPTYASSAEAPSIEKNLRAKGISYTKKTVG